MAPAQDVSDRLAYIPPRLSLLPLLYTFALPPNAVLVHTSIPDGNLLLAVAGDLGPTQWGRLPLGCDSTPADAVGDTTSIRSRRDTP